MDMPFFSFLLNASYMIMFRSSFCIKAGEGKIRAWRRGKNRLYGVDMVFAFCCIPCSREGVRRLYVS